jgi:membrane-associated phospholipid phosphatase
VSALNLALFDLVGGGFAPHPALLRVASLLAEGSTWLCAALIVGAAWMQPAVRTRVALVLLVAGLASFISRELATAIGSPRPFMLGLSPQHIEHGARAGLPSTHASVMFTVAFMLLTDVRLRAIGWAVLAMSVLTAWSRVYVGVHFPVDVMAGALLGGGIAMAAQALRTGTGRLRERAEPQLTALSQALTGPRVGPLLLVGFALVATWVGLNTPLRIRPDLLQEGGLVENGTLFFYLLAAAVVVKMRPPAWSKRDIGALSIVLLALAAREADLHIALFGISILKTRFYSGGTLWQIAVALAVLAPIAVAAGWLLRRSHRVWRSALARRRWRGAARTALAFVVAIVTAKTLDRLPAILLDTGLLHELPYTWRYLMLSLEEIIELALPLLALLALAQLWLGRHPTWLRRNGRSPRLAKAA